MNEAVRERLRPPLIYPAVPVVAFAVVSVLLWLSFGIRHANDAEFFLSGARSLRDGRLPNAAYLSYLGYLAFVAMVQALGLGIRTVVFAQWLISGIVVVATYDLGRRLAGPVAGSMAATLYAINVDMARFTFYVLSDSLFASALLLALYATFRAATDSRRWRLVAACACVAVALIRTNGWLMAPILAEWLIRATMPAARNRWFARIALGACYATCVLVGFSRIGAGGVGYDFLRTGRVIWLDPASWIAMPPAATPRPGWPPAVDYAIQHPVATMNLMSRRVLVEVAHTRRFYSRAHNLVVAIAVWSGYLLAGAGWYLHRHRHAAIVRVTILLVCAQLCIVAMTAADWDGRFLIAVVPLLTVWSGVGLAWLVGAATVPSGAQLPRLAIRCQ